MTHHRPTTAVPTDPVVTRARRVLLGLFALTGLMVSSWLARLPAVRDALDLSTGQLGAVLLVGAAGGLAAVTLAGAAVTRWGGRAVLVLAAAGSSTGYVLLGVGAAVGAVPVLAAGVLLHGVTFALSNVPLNVEAAGVERRLGRTVLPHFHAAFSIGAVLGSMLGAVMAQLGVTVLAQFTATAALTLVWRLLSIPHVVLETRTTRHAGRRSAEPASDGAPSIGGGGLRRSLGAWRERRTLLLGLVVMSAALSEGSANNWLALAVVDGFGRPESVGAVVFGLFVGAMMLVRILGTRLIDRYGRVAVLRTSGIVSLVGLLLFGLGPNLAVAGVGVVAWGLGAALAVPIGLAAASDDPLRAAGRVSVVSAFASLANLAAPPLLGVVADGVGTRHALLLITGAMVLSVLLSGHVARPGARPDAAVEPARRPASPMGDTEGVATAARASSGPCATAGARSLPRERRAGAGPVLPGARGHRRRPSTGPHPVGEPARPVARTSTRPDPSPEVTR